MALADTRWLSGDIGIIDLNFQGMPRVIAAYVARTDDGAALIEVGPASTIEALIEGLAALGVEPDAVRHLLVTHIHLDHVGAAGLLMDRWPHANLSVHEAGAPHAVDPTSLVRSATRIYGDEMDTLWGEIRAIPAERVRPVADGDELNIGGRKMRVLYTPGHASHHVAYHDVASNWVFAGDVAGVRIPPSRMAIPPTPPPDVDVPLWHDSLSTLRAIQPDRLLLTHFGPVDDVDGQLSDVGRHLDDWVANIAALLASGADRDTLIAWLESRVRAQLSAAGDVASEDAFALATPYGMAIDGLVRYLRKRDER
ncbi:MAG TPA: MBL fold metallo-hydrolase [Thermomicrobiales bacterium]|nr:MBL fold metallo-hydrolase [Thermomicrobiales bacterium]